MELKCRKDMWVGRVGRESDYGSKRAGKLRCVLFPMKNEKTNLWITRNYLETDFPLRLSFLFLEARETMVAQIVGQRAVML